MESGFVTFWGSRLRLVVAPSVALMIAGCVTAGGPSRVAAAPADGVQVEQRSEVLKGMVSEAQLEQAAGQQFQQLKGQASQKGQLLPASHPISQRVQAITRRLLPHAPAWNPRARTWQWEAVVLKSDQVNAFCMPGGKMAVYTGLVEQLRLTDDELAAVMGHEMAHALREHSRSQIAKQQLTEMGAGIAASLLGFGEGGQRLLGMGGQLLTLKFSRTDETDADLVGLDISARAGYDPRAAITLWQKMLKAGGGGGMEFLSTHPSGTTRIQDIERVLPQVMPLYERARAR